MLVLRCSSLPLFFACPRALDGDLQIKERFEATDLGSAVAQAIEVIVAGGFPDLDAISARWSVSRDELGRLTWYARKAVAALSGSFPLSRAEVYAQADFEWLALTGHVDYISDVGDTINIVDFKSGRVDSDFYHQLAGYAVCFLKARPEISKVTVSVVWLREQEIETYEITRPVMDQWLDRLRLHATRRQYMTGRHCEHCPRSHSCEALKAKAREGVEILTGAELDIATMPQADVVALYRRARLVAKVADSMISSIRVHVSNSGPQDSGDGHVLKITDERGGRDVDPELAWPILQKHLPDARAMASVLKVRATALDEYVATAAGHGEGAQAKRDLAAELEAVGAVRQVTISKLKELRKPKEIKAK